MFVCLCVYVCVCVCVHAYVYMYTYIYTFIRTYIHTYTYHNEQYIYIYIYISCVFQCVCIYTHVYIHKYIHTYVYTYIHTYIHTSIHICTDPIPLKYHLLHLLPPRPAPVLSLPPGANPFHTKKKGASSTAHPGGRCQGEMNSPESAKTKTKLIKPKNVRSTKHGAFWQALSRRN